MSGTLFLGESSGSDTTDDVEVVDIDGDGSSDIAAALPLRDSTLLFYSDGQGNLLSPRRVDTSATPNSIELGDMNADGVMDLVASNTGTASGLGEGVSIGLGDRAGGYLPYTLLGGEADQVQLAELTSDGILDVDLEGDLDAVVAAQAVPPGLSILFNDDQGDFSQFVDLPLPVTFLCCVESADFNRGGLPDLARHP